MTDQWTKGYLAAREDAARIYDNHAEHALTLKALGSLAASRAEGFREEAARIRAMEPPPALPNLLDARLAAADRLAEALEGMRHAFTSKTGFVEAVKMITGLAFPWPGGDVADQEAVDALAAYRATEVPDASQ